MHMLCFGEADAKMWQCFHRSCQFLTLCIKFSYTYL